jgi:hypothetical protein
VGKKCAVIARVKDDVYNVDQEGLIVLEVKKAELMKQLSPTQASTSKSNQATGNESTTPAVLPIHTDCPPESNTDAMNTPPRDVIDQAGTDSEKELLSPTDSKIRKTTNSSGTNTTRKVICFSTHTTISGVASPTYLLAMTPTSS